MIGSPVQLIIILAIVLVLFGAKKLRNVGSDLGSAIKNFRESVKQGDETEQAKPEDTTRIEPGRVIDAEHVSVKDKDHV